MVAAAIAVAAMAAAAVVVVVVLSVELRYLVHAQELSNPFLILVG